MMKRLYCLLKELLGIAIGCTLVIGAFWLLGAFSPQSNIVPQNSSSVVPLPYTAVIISSPKEVAGTGQSIVIFAPENNLNDQRQGLVPTTILIKKDDRVKVSILHLDGNPGTMGAVYVISKE